MANTKAEHHKRVDEALNLKGGKEFEEDLQALSDFVKSLKTVKRFEILPYHTLGVFKWHDLGVKYELEDIMPPTKEEIQRADDILHTGDYKGYLEK